jgi:Protein of unknown function (DUF2948)
MAEALKLRARDGGDLEMIAAILQDALVPLDNMKYLPREQRFALLLNRFRWEGAPKERVGKAGSPSGRRSKSGSGQDARFADQDATAFERVHAALVFDKVQTVKHRGMGTAAKGGVLALLTLRLEDAVVVIAFAGGAEIRLEVEQLSCHLEDLGEPWPTVWRPQHSESETSGGLP